MQTHGMPRPYGGEEPPIWRRSKNGKMACHCKTKKVPGFPTNPAATQKRLKPGATRRRAQHIVPLRKQ